MKTRLLILFAISTLLFIACEDDNPSPDAQEYVFEFSENDQGWTGGFADYSTGMEDNIDFSYSFETLPAPLNQQEGALRLSGTNVSDDLFMFAKYELSGLEADTDYQLTFELTIASDVPDGQVGIGGSPGESVFIKAGGSSQEPVKNLNEEDMYRMNIDIGNQSQGGADMNVLGDFSNDTDLEEYVLKTLSSNSPVQVTTDDNGNAWVLVGTDSGFEGKTTIYYDRVEVIATP